MCDPDSNLILRWLASLTDQQRAALTVRYTRRLSKKTAAQKTTANRHHPVRALGKLLFVDCAASLGLSPVELRGLLIDPPRHIAESIMWLALEQIATMRDHQYCDSAQLIDVPEDESWTELPARIVRRINGMSF